MTHECILRSVNICSPLHQHVMAVRIMVRIMVLLKSCTLFLDHHGLLQLFKQQRILQAWLRSSQRYTTDRVPSIRTRSMQEEWQGLLSRAALLA